MKRALSIFIIFIMSLVFLGCGEIDLVEENSNIELGSEESNGASQIDEDGTYTDHEDVALYVHTFEKLPDNFITKSEARDLGWEASKGNLWEVADGKSIGGDRFGNREGLLPNKEGRQFFEADVNYEGGYREAERIIYSNDGLIYYTDDHYDSFTLMYGEE